VSFWTRWLGKNQGFLHPPSIPRQAVEFLRHIGDGNVASGCVRTRDQLDFPFRRFFADGDAIRDADQVRIFKFYASAFVAIVEENIETGGFEFRCDSFARGVEGRVGDVGDGDDDIEGSDGAREPESVGVVPCSMAAVRMRSMPMP
jgi:hypothetical protein